MSKFVKLTLKKNNPVGGGSHLCNMLVNTDNILYIEQFSSAYRIRLVGREEIIIEEEDYKQLIAQLKY